MTGPFVFLAVLAGAYAALQIYLRNHGGLGHGTQQIDSSQLPLALKKICQTETDPELAQAQARYNEWIESEKTDALKARAKLEKRAEQKRLREARKLVKSAQPKRTATIIKMQREQEK
jgi:hypothetical protein